MSALRILWKKEWLQHRVVLTVMALLMALLFVLQLGGLVASGQVLSQLEALRLFLIPTLPPAALVLGHRLVVQEYYGHTQRFVESLPIGTGRLELTKLLFGLLYLYGLVGTALGVAVFIASGQEPIEARFAAIMAGRAAGYVWALWGVVFMMGFLGRLRVPLYVALAAGLLFLDRATPFEFWRFGPLNLVNAHTFAFERTSFPWQDFAIAVGLGLGAVLVALLLAYLRDGSVVEMLAQPMSQREKSFTFLLVVGVLGAVAFAGPDILAEPYRFDAQEVVTDRDNKVEVLYLDESLRHEGERWAQHLASVRRELRAALGWEQDQLWLRLALEPTMPTEVDTVRMDRKSGIVLRTDYRSDRIEDAATLTALMVHQLIALQSGERTMVEAKHWVLDGFSRWWAERYYQWEVSPALLHGLVVAKQLEPTAADVRAWDVLSERVGERGSTALAYTLLRALEELQGRGAVLRLARAVFAGSEARGLAGWWQDRAHPLPVVFEETTGMSYGRFFLRFGAWYRAQLQQPRIAHALARVPEGTARFDASNRREGVKVAARLEQPPGTELVCELRHIDLPPYDEPMPQDEPRKREILWPPEQAEYRTALMGTYSPGQRLFVAFDCRVDVLRAPLRLGVRRMTVR